MKVLSEPREEEAPSAWGRWAKRWTHDEEIELSDVGRKRPHYLGMNHRIYTIKASDVGKTITVYSDKQGWTCWSFKS